MAILLTGSHTAAACAAAGYDVVIADDFSNSSPDVPRRLEEITGRKMAVCRVDAADREAMRAVFAAHSIDAVIHFAGFKAVGESVRKPVKYYRNNLDTTLTLLEVMAEFGCRRLVFSSSATVYGGESPSPLTEDMPVGQCTNPYGRTKYFIEEILRDAAAAEPELSVVLLRYFNPIGAHESGRIGERPNGVPNNLMPYVTQVAAGIREKLSVFGSDYPTPDGTCIRDYVHVMDLAEGHAAALAYAQEHTGAEVFNLGTGRGTSVLELIDAFQQATGVTVPYVMAGRRGGGVLRRDGEGGAGAALAGAAVAGGYVPRRLALAAVRGRMNTNQKIRDTQGVSRIFWLFYRWARRSGAEEAIEAVTAYRGEGEANMDERH